VRIEVADVSLIGGRQENQDRVAVVGDGPAVLLVAVDGMGGHADGARAAQVAVDTLREAFARQSLPVLDPQGFLHHALGRAHANLVALGQKLPLESRPRATCAVCLVQDGGAYWAHIGDSRIYHLAGGKVAVRSRDHSHVELLLQDGVITEAEVAAHPMRNYVECCLGGDVGLPGMSITARRALAPGDAVIVCTDGFWSHLGEELLAGLSTGSDALAAGLKRLGDLAVRAGGAHCDNASAAALRYLG
jgi:serine/threonine protein phosphatase PrpC